MSNPFRVLGHVPAIMRARKDEMKEILGNLERDTPVHTSVVGVKYIGKTVFLSAVVEYFKNESKIFDACVYWNIGSFTPENDEEFFIKLGKELAAPIGNIDSTYQELLENNANSVLLGDVFRNLQKDNKKILLVIDRFDELLQVGTLSRTLWDNLRYLGELSSLYFVTGSCKELGELIGPDEIAGSPFWNLFDPQPLTLKAFKVDDLDDFLLPFNERKINVGKGTKPELINSTGGMPILLSSLCHHLWNELADEDSITNETINKAAKIFVKNNQVILRKIWDNCTIEQGTIEDLATGKITSVKADKIRQSLENRGVILGKNGQVCSIIKKFIEFEQPQIRDLERLFGKNDYFEKNIRKVLQLRLNQLNGIDKELRITLQNMINKLEHPKNFVREIRGLVDRAFVVIWDKELPSRTIPDLWSQRWKYAGEDKAPSGTISDSLATQCYLLDLMTNNGLEGNTRISRTSYLMISSLKNIGDFGQHLGVYEVSSNFVFAICLMSIEMCEQVASDLAK